MLNNWTGKYNGSGKIMKNINVIIFSKDLTIYGIIGILLKMQSQWKYIFYTLYVYGPVNRASIHFILWSLNHLACMSVNTSFGINLNVQHQNFLFNMEHWYHNTWNVNKLLYCFSYCFFTSNNIYIHLLYTIALFYTMNIPFYHFFILLYINIGVIF